MYNEEVRTFGLTLHYYSPKAYNYVRSKFNNNLPSISAMRSWYSSINSSPGFTTEAFECLRNKAELLKSEGKELYCNLVFDEVAIRQHIQWNASRKKFDGFVDVGRLTSEGEVIPVAKEALVYLVSGITEDFKIPVGYFLIAGLKTEEKVALTHQALVRLSEIGVQIVSMTFDGLPTNISMCKYLGADFENGKAYIYDPVKPEHKIYVLLDAAHLLKCARGCVATRNIVDGEGRIIKWKYFEAIYESQKSLPYNLGNKLTKTHMQWAKKKMSVKIAGETLNHCVADSMEFLKGECEEFTDADGTINFIRVVKDVFDIMNSTNSKKATGFKRPISKSTYCEFFERFDEATLYFKQLRIEGDQKFITETKSHTPFTGFISNMANFKNIYKDYVETDKMNELITHRFSQDLLESFFSCVRGMNGFNDNPNAQQFEAAYRKLLVHNDVMSSEKANCIDSGTKILTVSSQRKKMPSSSTTEEIDPRLFEDWEDIFRFDNYIDDTHSHSVAYMASMIETKIIQGKRPTRLVKCQRCIDAFVENELIEDSFIRFKARRTNITQPCKSSFEICKIIETFLKPHEDKSFSYNAAVIHVLRNLDFDVLYPSSNFENHSEAGHKYELVKKIVETFMNMRSVHVAKCITLKTHDTPIRQDLKKKIHFGGQ